MKSDFVTKTYGATPFDQFLDWEEIPDDLGAKNPQIREIKPEELLETRFLRELKAKDSSAGTQYHKD